MKVRKLLLALSLALFMAALPITPFIGGISEVRAENIEDLSEEGGSTNVLGNSTADQYDTGVADLFKNHRTMTPEQLEKANYNLSPVTNLMGSLIGIIMVLVCSGIFVITALDLLYIAIPPLRGILYKGAQDEMQGGMMNGYGGGFGGGYGGRMGGYGGGGRAQRGLRFQLISDEAVQCSMLIGGGQQSAGGGMPGGYMSNNYGSPQQEMSNRSVVLTYLKKRIVFMIIFAICSVMLTSSIFLGTGINIAQWLTKMVELLNNSIPH